MTSTTSSSTTSEKRRNRIGTKNGDLYQWTHIPYDQINSNYATQEYIQDKIRENESVEDIIEPPESHDLHVWQYEQIRQFTLELNHFAVHFSDVCTAKTCPKMKATEDWLFLCASHKATQECSAIDYFFHTLDNTSALLNSEKLFPKRIEISTSSLKQFPSIMRRLYRLFAHAYFHHREIYDQIEEQTHLCERFVTFALKYSLVPPSSLIIPSPK
ncbi:MOB1 [Cavenderia fasciculata]|uniref:MOB1 n=1 Tax=Cavenderia fasciculata TaxID=261658 RepID=F4PWW0_CACFS|nr:MOB1 [Cavenderia fasciculata]EGG19763.1 MOB1 [Cavenderia fasciculata]|eukprot:XP_004358109.1 MOB1 [Cavenderia fasciculata]